MDDHPLIRKGLCHAINAEADLRVCGESASCRETLHDLQTQTPDVLVLDLSLSDGNGWRLMQQLRAQGNLPPTLILSVCDEEIYAKRLLQDGARGYLMKDEPIPAVLAAIRKILAGHLAFSDHMVARMLQPENAPSVQLMDHLSNRELQVYGLLGQEMGNKAIAARLGISPKTIGTYKSRLRVKLDLRTTHDLLEHARGGYLGDQV
ncbi:response regulator transcription factor [Desulfonatronum sp. SC1]|uniref:response regulator n=1 Tax=Desulfonatronum sp. SC1 TaxID=2109626 RepID=UPI0013049DBD|nr:response regulator transcription factor [Desulfonatronum sp. SC1]